MHNLFKSSHYFLALLFFTLTACGGSDDPTPPGNDVAGAPGVTAPANISIEATAVLTAVVLGTASANDAEDGALTPTANNIGPFPLGTTEVTWSATDSDGNVGTSTQSVTVQDTTEPNLTIPSDVNVATTLTPPIAVTIGVATATDIFVVASITNNAPSNFNLGTTEVIWTATDVNGNSRTGTQQVTVTLAVAAQVIINADTIILSEDGGEGTFSLVLNREPTGDVEVIYACSDTSECIVTSLPILFTRGNFDVPQIVTLSTVGIPADGADGNQSVSVDGRIGANTTDTSGFETLTPGQVPDVPVTVTDAAAPGVTAFPINPTITEKGGTGNIVVVLNTQPNGLVVLDLVTSDTTELFLGNTRLTFDASNWNNPQTVGFSGVDDSIVDGPQDVRIDVNINVALTPDTTGYASIGGTRTSVTVTDDEEFGITLTPIKTTFSENGGRGSFLVQLNSQPNGPVTIDIISDDLNEVLVENSQFMVSPTNWQDESPAIFLSGVNDDLADGDKSVSIRVVVSNTTDTTGYAGFETSITVTVQDDETASITATLTGPKEIVENPTEFTSFVVVLSNKPDGIVVIDVISGDETQATVGKSELRFDSVNYSTPQTVSVASVDDEVFDPTTPVTITITVNTATTTSLGYLDAAPAEILVLVVDDRPADSIYVNDYNSLGAIGTVHEYRPDGSFVESTSTNFTENVSIAVYREDIYANGSEFDGNFISGCRLIKNGVVIGSFPNATLPLLNCVDAKLAVNSTGVFIQGGLLGDVTGGYVFHFDLEGNFIKQFPTKFYFTTSMCVNDFGLLKIIRSSKLEIFDATPNIEFFNLEGDLLNEVSIEPYAMGCSATRDQFYVLEPVPLEPQGPVVPGTYILQVYSNAGVKLRSLLIPGGPTTDAIEAVEVTEDNVYLVTPNKITVLDRNVSRDSNGVIISETLTDNNFFFPILSPGVGGAGFVRPIEIKTDAFYRRKLD